MRRIMLTFALMLCASQVEADVFFRPDFFSLKVSPLFNDTGTNAVCWQCIDANPLNNVNAVLGGFQNVIGADWNQFLPYAGLLGLQSTATNYRGLELNFSLRATLTAWGASLPESLARPSVSFGMIPGRLLGVNDGSALVLECCDGFVGPLYVQQAFYPSSPFIVPPGGLSKLVALELHPFADQVAYTPITPVPEPTSLFLLGSALASTALRRRRANDASAPDSLSLRVRRPW